MATTLLDSLSAKNLKTSGPESSERLKQSRAQALEKFEALRWPVKTDEEWRRTDPAQIPLSGIDPAATALSPAVGWNPVEPESIRSGVILTDLAAAFRQFPQLVEEHLFQTGAPEGLPKYVSLHGALWKQGLFCYVPDGVSVKLPLRAWLEIPKTETAVFPHILIVLGEGAEATLIDERRGGRTGTDPLFSNEMVEIVLKPGAHLQYVHLQRWGQPVTELFTQRTVLEKDAIFLNVTVGLGGRLTKANVETILTGTGGRAELLGVLFGSENQHFDFHTLQDHLAPNTFSDLLYKSALKDLSKSVYTGLIRIHKEAQKSDAYQANRNLLLSQGAKADSIPMLEILANDVRCTHGVAVGPIDEEQAFYLMSRGLGPAEAERLIVEGFFEQVFRRIPTDDLREQLMSDVTNRLKNKNYK